MFERRRNSAISFVVILILGFIIGYSASDQKAPQADPIGNQPAESLELENYWKVWERVNEKYVDAADVDPEKAVYGSIKGLVKSLDDPYSSYMTPAEAEIFETGLNNELQGIGAELTMEDGLLTVVSPLKNSPAERAGIQPQDIIIRIDGEDATDYEFIEAIQKIRGDAGTKVDLTIYRDGHDDPFEFTITRDEINLDSVTHESLEDDIYYIAINQFSDDTEKEFFNAVKEVLLASPKGLILDLRYNGGGYLDSSVQILGEFVEEGEVGVIVEATAAKEREVLKTTGSSRLKDIPLVVLVNKGSASASEILAGALQDHERAILIGVQTFGKGTVQEVQDLEDGSSLRLTIAKWYTPLEQELDGIGLLPDLIVPLASEDEDDLRDMQLEKAKEYLSNL